MLPLPQTMPDIVARIEEAYGDWGRQQAINRPRTDMVSEHGEGTYRVFKSMEGCVPAMGIVALRTNSLRQSWHPSGTGVTKRLEQTAGSLIFLFSTESGELLAICPDERLQRMRVGATSAVAARRLAPERPLRMALLGSSGQARYHLLAMVASLQVTRVDVYSPNAEHAQQLVDDVRPLVA
ncbi:MAG TPA: hypothetical protein VMW62_13900, partial [Chloroflexota bacterium]|nr:hypothetical protein [Chloroflexota bacterium]